MSRYDIPSPKCNHVNQNVRVSSHVNLIEANKTGEPMASVWVCSRDVCIQDAREWVSAQGCTPVVIRK